MADDKRIVIELRLSSGGGGDGGGSDDGGRNVHDETANINYFIHPIKSAEKALLGKSVLVNQAYGYAKQAVIKAVQYGVNRHFNLSENYLAQNDMQNALTTIGKVSSFAATVGAGLIMGTPVGAAVAAAGWLVNEGIEIYRRFDQADIQLTEINVESNFQRVRLGLVDGGRGTQN